MFYRILVLNGRKCCWKPRPGQTKKWTFVDGPSLSLRLFWSGLDWTAEAELIFRVSVSKQENFTRLAESISQDSISVCTHDLLYFLTLIQYPQNHPGTHFQIFSTKAMASGMYHHRHFCWAAPHSTCYRNAGLDSAEPLYISVHL